jgi:hypothetical protein
MQAALGAKAAAAASAAKAELADIRQLEGLRGRPGNLGADGRTLDWGPARRTATHIVRTDGAEAVEAAEVVEDAAIVEAVAIPVAAAATLLAGIAGTYYAIAHHDQLEAAVAKDLADRGESPSDELTTGVEPLTGWDTLAKARANQAEQLLERELYDDIARRREAALAEAPAPPLVHLDAFAPPDGDVDVLPSPEH